MKHDWKTAEKQYYSPSKKPQPVEIPSFKYISLAGRGNPNGEPFGKKVEALFSISYKIKMMAKKSQIPHHTLDYAVYPLEAVWRSAPGDALVKDNLEYTVMIRQPPKAGFTNRDRGRPLYPDPAYRPL